MIFSRSEVIFSRAVSKLFVLEADDGHPLALVWTFGDVVHRHAVETFLGAPDGLHLLVSLVALFRSACE